MGLLAQNVLDRWRSVRVAARFAAKEVPVRNKDYDNKIVWVLPETLKDNPSKYKIVSPKEMEQPYLAPDKPHRPERPKKPHEPALPHKSRVPRDPLPHPAYRPKLPKPVSPAPPIKPIGIVPPPLVPVSPKPTRRK